MDALEYQRYLKDHHWRMFRKWILRQRGGACEKCGISNVWSIMAYGQPINVHHISYDHLGQERPEDVVVLCRRCHEEAHCTAWLPDMSAIFWKVCVGLKERPEETWNLLRSIDELPIVRDRQLILPLLS